MTTTNRFYRDDDGWFIDLPEWPGSKDALAMVLGADDMLETLAEGKSEVIVTFSNQNFENAEVLTKLRDDSDIGGAHYIWAPAQELWLCDVTKFIFGTMPDKIYLKRIG